MSLQLHWKYQFQFAGFIMAKEKGYYEDVGLDVELKEYSFGINVENEVLSQRANYGIYSSAILLSYLQGKPIELMASFFKRSAMVILAKPEIKSPKDLIGKTIMADTKKDFDLKFKHMFNSLAIDTGDLNLVKHTYNVDDFANDSVDAMTSFISDQPYKLDVLGIKYNILDPSDYGVYSLMLELFTSVNEAEEHLQRTQKFKEASIKGWKYALENINKTIDVIHAKYTPDMPKETLLSEAHRIKKLILPYVYEIGSIDENYLIKQTVLFEDYYHLKEHAQIDSFIFNKQNSIDHTLFWQLLAVTSILFLIALSFILILRKNNKKLHKLLNSMKQAKEENHYLSERIKLAFDGSRDGLWDWNLIDNSVYFSARWKEMLGHEDSELVNDFDTWKSRVHPDDLENTMKDIELSMHDKNGMFENKHRLRHKDGHWVWIYDRGKVQRDKEGKAIRMIGTHTDLTAEINLSKELRTLNENLETRVNEQVNELKSQHMFIAQQRKLASMGEMLSIIAHQWRQPLNNINSNVAVMGSVLTKETIDKNILQKQMEKIENNTQYLSNTIEEFSNFFRPNKPKKEFIVQDNIKSALKLLAPRIKGIEINTMQNKEIKLCTFKEEYQQVVMIILNNAIDNFESKSIEDPKINMIISEDKQSTHLSICDNGGGIDNDKIDHIFDPYYTTRLSKEGIGLGLYIAKMLIKDSMQGVLEAKNTKYGICFEITVPKGESDA